VLLVGDSLPGVDIIPAFIKKGDPEIFGISIYHFPHNWRVSLSMVPEMNSFREVADPP
jgi:hypothetical protein